jgi:diacylglycerol kinase family enzyme
MRHDVCVIYNPASGKGRGRDRLERLRRVLGGRADFRPTRRPGDGEALALAAADSGFTTVVAAGGDGTVHEVANGLLRSGRPDVTLAVVPVGSANDYAHSLGLDAGWWQRRDPAVGVRAVDVGVVRSGARSRYFVNGLGLGFNGAVTLESRRIKRLQGLALYGLALMRALLYHFRRPMMRVRLDDGPDLVGPTLALTLALGRREGNFVVAPDAVLDDGLFDYLYAGDLTRRQALRLLPALALGRLPKDHLVLRMGRCRRAALTCETPLTVHTDGEFFSRPEDGVRELEVELLPQRLRVFNKLGSDSRSATNKVRPHRVDRAP